MENTPLIAEKNIDDKESESGLNNLEKNKPGKSRSKSSEAAGRLAAREANQLHTTQEAPEHIGHMLISAETPEITQENTKETAKTTPEQRVDTMARADLLQLSEKITIDGTTLRQIYESHLIGERGLRRLVAEYQQDGDLRQALRHEVVEREMDFERDPAMRDLAAPLGNAISDSSKAALNTLLEKAAVSIVGSGEQAAFFKARARYEAVQIQQQQKQRHRIDIALTVVITILLALVLFMFLARN